MFTYSLLIQIKLILIFHLYRHQYSYLIKYLTPETKYPVELTDFSNDSTTKWFKYGSQKYVDQLETFGSLLSFNKTKQRNNLVLKSFNKNILDHYETQPLFDDNQLGIDEG